MPDSIRARIFELKERLNTIVEAFNHLHSGQAGTISPVVKTLASYVYQEFSMIQSFISTTTSVRTGPPRVISIEHGTWPSEAQDAFFLTKIVGGD